MKQLGKYKHEWKFDLPWHMVDLRDWFYSDKDQPKRDNTDWKYYGC